MKFIGNLFAPRWKHKNPQVRKQALVALDKTRQETQKILLQVAQSDPELFIRRLAIKRLTDIDAVQALRQSAPREEIYQDATWRLCILLSGEGGTANTESIDAIRARLDQYTESKIIEYVAKHATNLDLQKHALDKINNENTIIEIITGTEHGDLRRYALEKLHSPGALKRAIKLLKRKDKELTALVQEKLDQINAAVAHRNELVSQHKQIGNEFLKLVALCNLSNEWAKYESRLRSLHEQWRGLGVQLDAQALNAQTKLQEHGQSEQIEQAFTLFEQQLKQSANREAWEVSPEVNHAQTIDELLAVNRKLFERVSQLSNLDSRQSPDNAELDQFIAAVKRDWRHYYNEIISATGAALPFADLPQTKMEFEANLAKLEQIRSDMPVLKHYHEQLNVIVADAENVLNSNQGLSQDDVTRLEKRFAQLALPVHLKVDRELAESWNDLLNKLRQTLNKQDEQRESMLSEFAELTHQLADKIAGGRSKPASQLINRGKKLLKQLDAQAKSALDRSGDLARFNQLAQELSELQGWRQWSSAPVKEQQITDMQELAQELEANRGNSHYDFVTAANAIKTARKEWKSLTVGEPAGDQVLWQQFDDACNQAYAVCQEHFDQQAELRGDNLQKREQFCLELAAYQDKVAGQEPQDIDWKAMQKIIQTARKDWGQLGIVNRSDRAKINKRYNQIIHALEKMLRSQQQNNRETKEMLIKRVQHLSKQLADEAVNVEQATESVKQVQAEWKRVGPAIKESQLWDQFRESCDAVFQVQRAEREAVNQAREEEKQKREALIKVVDDAAKLKDEALLQSRANIDKAKADWAELPRLKKDHALERQFSRACQQFDKQLTILHAEQLRTEKQKLQQNVALCHQLEKALFECLQGKVSASSLEESVLQLEQRWSPVDARLRPVDQAVKHRFEQAKSYARQCSDGDASVLLSELSEQEHTSTESKELLCIQMELLAGIESPPESQQRRMKYQVEQLAEKMKQSQNQNVDEEIEKLLSQWQRSGFMDPAKAQPLEQRFYSVLQSLDKDYQYNS